MTKGVSEYFQFGLKMVSLDSSGTLASKLGLGSDATFTFEYVSTAGGAFLKRLNKAA